MRLTWESISKLVQDAILSLGMCIVTLTGIVLVPMLLILFVTLAACLWIVGAAIVFLCSECSNILDILKSKKSSLKFADYCARVGLSNLTFQTLTGFWKGTGTPHSSRQDGMKNGSCTPSSEARTDLGCSTNGDGTKSD
jgi:hypothetical protein